MQDITDKIAGEMIRYISTKLMDIGYKKFQDLRGVGFENIGLKIPHSLYGDNYRFPDQGYGRVIYTMLVEGVPNTSKIIKSGDLKIKISNFKLIEFQHLLYAYKFETLQLGDYFILYGMNNGTDIRNKEVTVTFKLSDGTLIMNEIIRVSLGAGRTKELVKICLNSNRKLVDNVKKSIDKSLEIYVDGDMVMVLELNNDRFKQGIIQPAPCPPVEPDISVCVADYVVKHDEETTLKNHIEINERYTILKINFFPEYSSSFEFSIIYKGKEIGKEKVKVMVPFFDIEDMYTKYFDFNKAYNKYNMSKYFETRNS